MPAECVENLLRDPRRQWTGEPPARPEELAELIRRAPFELPREYLELLGHCNGGKGDLDLPPLLFVLDPIAKALSYNESEFRREELAHFWFFGGNGGLEMIGFDLRQGPAWRIVMIDPIAGRESARVIAANMEEFITKIGTAHPD